MIEAMNLPVSTNPLEDESLIGFIVRACDRNGHIDVVHALRLAGSHAARAHFLVRDREADVTRLSRFFGCSEDDWRRRLHGRTGMAGFVDYFGVPIRAQFRQPTTRRVSPAALRSSVHHRAIWQLKPFHYCPETGELLISKCPNPNCGRELRWNRTYGVQYCEFCVDSNAEPTADLRSLQPPKLVGGDLKIYVSIANLLDWRLEDDALINPALLDWPRWELFDLVVLIAAILSKRFEDRFGLKKVDTFSLPDWHMNFMLACRAVLDWPKSFYDVVELMRENSEGRPGYYGRMKEVGDLGCNLRRRYHATDRIAAEITKQLDSFFASKGWTTPRNYYAAVENSNEWISFSEARAKYPTRALLSSLIETRDIAVQRAEVAKRAPVFFRKAELEALMKKRESLVCVDRLPVLTGFSQSVIHGLSQSGHICFGIGAAARFRLPCLEPAEIKRLERRLAENASSPIQEQVPLLTALRDKGAGEILLKITRGCLDGDFRYSLARRGVNILSRLMVLADDIPLPGMQFEPSVVFPGKMTAADVETLLDISPGDIPGLLEQGYLERRGRYLDGQSVRRLATKYISNVCLARRLNHAVRSMKRFMASHGVRPSIIYTAAHGAPFYLWRRTKVAATFGLK
ncbi:MAG TPA: TniQ family protein [Bradyrhizobium sp.]